MDPAGAPSSHVFAQVAKLDEPVRRYLRHAIRPGAPLHHRVRLEMQGRIHVGPWLSFAAVQRFDGHSFLWQARAGIGRVRPLHVVDSYRPGEGRTSGRL